VPLRLVGSEMCIRDRFCLAQAMLPLIEDQDLTMQVLEGYKNTFPRALGDAMRAKLGLKGDLVSDELREADWSLVEDLLQLLAAQRLDFTHFWRQLSHAVAGHTTGHLAAFEPVRDLLVDRASWQDWLARYLQRLGEVPFSQVGQNMLRVNPKFVLRNHLAEIAIRKAQAGDYSEIETLHNLLKSPFDEHPGFEAYADLPPDWASHLEISCSS
jgi:uncharacterized protein YdiU (UPF0061 family)